MSASFLVIIPTFRRPEYLPDAVRSALNQTGVSVKIVVVDDCPNGSAETQIKAFNDPRVSYVKMPNATGGWPSRVRNYGFEHAQSVRMEGDFVHFLDDDDIVPEGHYASVAQVFADHKEAGMVFGAIEPFVTFSGDGKIRALQEKVLRQEQAYFAGAARDARTYRRIGSLLPGNAATQVLYTIRALFGPPMFVCSSVIIRREHAVALNGFDPNIRLMEDNEFYARAMRRFGAYFIDRVSLKYRVGSASALMHSLELTADAKKKEIAEVKEGKAQKNAKLRDEIGTLGFYAGQLCFYGLLSPHVTLKGIQRRIVRKFA